MDVVTTVDAVRARVRQWRESGARIALVPTMGNLHAGHSSLLDVARARADRVIASVFVNPLQFGPAEDFAAYPRTLGDDQQLLASANCDLLFAPEVAQIYPEGGSQPTLITVRGLSSVLCGQFRPGHFDGVATVVAKLFNIVAPDVAVFGEKDYQQFIIIRRMTSDLQLPVGRRRADGARERRIGAELPQPLSLAAGARDGAGDLSRTEGRREAPRGRRSRLRRH